MPHELNCARLDEMDDPHRVAEMKDVLIGSEGQRSEPKVRKKRIHFREHDRDHISANVRGGKRLLN